MLKISILSYDNLKYNDFFKIYLFYQIKTNFMDIQKNRNFGKYQSVGGWLYLLCFSLIIGGPLRTLYNLLTSFNEVSPLFEQFPGLEILVYVDSFLSVTLMIFSVRAGNALWTFKPKAVKTAKNYFLIFLVYSVVAAFLPFVVGLPSEFMEAMIPEVMKSSIQALVFFGIWYSYLHVSKRVRETYIE